MPCRDDGPHISYVHADDCECKRCRTERRECKCQDRIKKKFAAIYTAKVKKLFGDERGHAIHIEPKQWHVGNVTVHDEIDMWEGGKPVVKTFAEWLDKCNPFPEKMKFKKVEAFGHLFLFTYHEHKGRS